MNPDDLPRYIVLVQAPEGWTSAKGHASEPKMHEAVLLADVRDMLALDNDLVDRVYRRLNAGLGHETTKDQIKAVLWAAMADEADPLEDKLP